MSQNTSHAVMAQRHEADDSLDDFPTQPWGTRALMEHVIKPMGARMGAVWEPACNRGYMQRPLEEYFVQAWGSDVFDYGIGAQVVDFLFPSPVLESPDWVITNPPFRLAEQFIARALDVAEEGCAVLVRTSFLEGQGRYQRLFSVNPPTIVAQFVERLPMVKGRVDRKASTATSYAWLVWMHGKQPRSFQWIPPCRARLERDSDYPAALSIAEAL